MCSARMGSNPILVYIFAHNWIREAKKLYQRPTKGESYKCHIQNTKKGFPTPGIEPGPPGWEPGILNTRPFTMGKWFLTDYSATVGRILTIFFADPMKFWFQLNAEKIIPLARLREGAHKNCITGIIFFWVAKNSPNFFCPFLSGGRLNLWEKYSET